MFQRSSSSVHALSSRYLCRVMHGPVITMLLGVMTACSTAPAPQVPVAVTVPVQPETTPAEDGFAACVGRLQQRALAEGISMATLDATLARVKPAERVLTLDRKQPEFSETFARYLTQRVNDQRIAKGQRLMKEHGRLLASIEHEYGVPAGILVSFWGLETNFGGFQGNLPVVQSLTTLACDQRRSAFFSTELMEALKLVDDGTVTSERLVGSWAGAMGNTQFMPSTYRRYAVDADGSGHADLWNSVPDALTSAANYLSRIGWLKGESWGVEVRLPDDFDYSLTSLDTRKSVADWVGMGVTSAAGDALPAFPGRTAILVPAGRQGPAFLVNTNFDVILKWNRSEYYALSVGHLADRLSRKGRFVRSLPDFPPLAIAQVKRLQARLNQDGYAAGTEDGVLGSGTRKALRAWQRQNGLVADGYPAPDVLEKMFSQTL